jgi:hypothetical protein
MSTKTTTTTTTTMIPQHLTSPSQTPATNYNNLIKDIELKSTTTTTNYKCLT